MKTIVKTTIKGSENITVKESVQVIFEELQKKTSFIMLTAIGFDGKESKAVIRKGSIKMVKR